jgi:peptidoglycan hydrolase-like protein with peptidoglycan-binding domain
MTTDTFGIDVASFQDGLTIGGLDASIQFVLAKVTEGTTYLDPDYAGWLAQARASRKLFVWYHFLTTGSAAAAQAAFTRTKVLDPSLPGMLDVETEGSSKPTLPDVLEYIDAAHALGLRIKLVYLPRWYWQQIGSPDLTPLAQRGVGVVTSMYPRSAAAGAAATYAADGGDAGAGWSQPYGGVTPVLWQYADDLPEEGQKVDVNAYKGSLEQLAAFLAEPIPSAPVVRVPAPGHPQVQQGSTGEQVSALQQLLTALGHSTGGVDGNFGPNTKAGVEAFQKSAGIHVDGQAGKDTNAHLMAALAGIRYGGVNLKLGATGDAVKTLQAALWWRGFDPKGVDGNFGTNTEAAVRAFQAAVSISRDGQAGPQTWGFLFQGK